MKRCCAVALTWLFAFVGGWVGLPSLSTGAAAPLPNAQSFQADTGLLVSEVEDWSAEGGSSHYRMRIYRFRVPQARLHQTLQALQMHPPAADDPFDQAITQLFAVVRPAGIADVSGAARTRIPRLSNGWGSLWLLPPYAQTRIGCYPTEHGYAFRIAIIQAQTSASDGLEVHFAAGGDLGRGLSPSNCLESRASFFMPMQAMLDRSAARVLPYPFAQRSFAEMVAADLTPVDLYYHGTYFVDSSHFFRFELDAATFAALLKAKAMVALRNDPETLAQLPDASGLGLEWWLSTDRAAQVQWFELCQQLEQTPARIRAARDDGKVYWYTSGLSKPQASASACSSPQP